MSVIKPRNAKPVLTFICVHTDGAGRRRAQATDGRIIVDVGSTFPFDVVLDATKFARAIRAIGKKEIKVKLTGTKRVSISGGKFRALLGTSEELFPLTKPSDTSVPCPSTLLDICSQLVKCIGLDASRPWSQSILIKDGVAYATNNVIIISLPAVGVPDCVIPVDTVEVLNGCSSPPSGMQVTESHIEFSFSNGDWIRCGILDQAWPPVEKFIVATDTVPLPDDFSDAILTLKPFCAEPKAPTVYCEGNVVSTSLEDIGATVELDTTGMKGKYRIEILQIIAEVATSVDFSGYPKACYFTGDNGVRGVFMGVR